MEQVAEKAGLVWEDMFPHSSMEVWTAGPYRVTSSSWQGVKAMIDGDMGVLRFPNVPAAKAACEHHHRTGEWK